MIRFLFKSPGFDCVAEGATILKASKSSESAESFRKLP